MNVIVAGSRNLNSEEHKKLLFAHIDNFHKLHGIKAMGMHGTPGFVR